MAVEIQDNKIELVIQPDDIASDATATGYLDTLGWDYLTMVVALTSCASTSEAWTTCTLREGTNSASTTPIVAFSGSDATNATYGYAFEAAANSVEGNVIRMNVDLRKRERYLSLIVTPDQAAASVAALAMLSRGREVPGSDAGSVQTDATG